MHEGPFRDPFGPHLPGVRKIPSATSVCSRGSSRRATSAPSSWEPIQGEGGVRVPAAAVRRRPSASSRRSTRSPWPTRSRPPDGRARSSACLAAAPLTSPGGAGGGLVLISRCSSTEDVHRRVRPRLEGGESHNVTFSATTPRRAVADDGALTDDVIAACGPRWRRRAEGALRVRELAGHPPAAAVRGEGFMLGIAEGARPSWPRLRAISPEAIGGSGRAQRGASRPRLRLHRQGPSAHPRPRPSVFPPPAALLRRRRHAQIGLHRSTRGAQIT